jgi:hypothetical protein
MALGIFTPLRRMARSRDWGKIAGMGHGSGGELGALKGEALDRATNSGRKILPAELEVLRRSSKGFDKW